jgi:trans-aconitate methyltransferase
MSQNTQQYYANTLKNHGDTPKGSLWGDHNIRDLYFKTTLMVSSWKGQSCLEVGCGTGALFEYIQNHKINLNYSGIDINGSAIDMAKKKHPNIKYDQVDLLDYQVDPKNKPDYVLAAGAFNFIDIQKQDRHDYINTVIKKMFDCSEKGMSLAIKTKDTPNSPHHLVSYDRFLLFEYASSLTPYVHLNHSFSEYFCTLFLYK